MNTHDEERIVSMGQQKEWVKEVHGIYAGLIAIAIVMIQPFLFQGQFTGTAAAVCVYSFAVSVPILSALLLLNYSEEFRLHLSTSKTVAVARVIAQLAAMSGVIAGFWHINQMAGILASAGGVIGLIAYTAGYSVLYRKRSSK